MEYESIMDIDEYIIVKLDKFYLGNIFIDDSMVAVCRFGSYHVELDISKKTKVDLSILFDLFEDEFSEVYDQLIEFYEDTDYLSIAEDNIASVSNKSVRRFCQATYIQLEKEHETDTRVELLNQLLSDSLLTPERLPSPEDACLYHTTRNLFVTESKRSSRDTTIYRFTVAKRVYEYLMRDDDFSVRIELVDSNCKIRFHVYEKLGDREVMVSESRRLFSNNDGSVRVNMAPAAYEWISNPKNEFELFIDIKNEELIFSLY